MRYMMKMGGSAAYLQWEYNFEQASDKMALEFAEHYLNFDPAARQALRIYLFNRDDDTCIGDFSYNLPTVTNMVKA